MHITKYLLGFLLMVQGTCLYSCQRRQGAKAIERKERLKKMVGILNKSSDNTGIMNSFNLQALVWVSVELSARSQKILNEAARLVQEAQYPAYGSLERSLSYDGVLIQQKNPFKNSKDVFEFKDYCGGNRHLNECFGVNLPIK